MARGKVKWFSDAKGFGFIEAENGPDVFVHYSAIESANRRKNLLEGEIVEYECVQGQKGPQAQRVQRLIEMDSE